MIITATLTKDDLEGLIKDALNKKIGTYLTGKTRIKIETKSKQNYKAEWETADFRAEIVVDTSIIEGD